MGDKVKALRKENDDLKRQLNDLMKEFQSIKSKMAEQKENHQAAATALPNTQDVSLRKLSKNAFKRKIKQTLFEILASEDCYIDLPEIVQKVKLNLFSS